MVVPEHVLNPIASAVVMIVVAAIACEDVSEQYMKVCTLSVCTVIFNPHHKCSLSKVYKSK
jgi:hypothetical protein